MKIYTLVIDHKYGTNISSYLSEAEMNRALYEYVKENWYEEDGSIEDRTREEAIEQYFHENTWVEEWYCTDYTDIPPLTQLIQTIEKIGKEPLWGEVENVDIRAAKEVGEWEGGSFSPSSETESSQLEYVVKLARQTANAISGQASFDFGRQK